MKKELMALLDKRRALKSEADAINATVEKADGIITAEQTARLTALHADGAKVSTDLDALAAALPDDPHKATADAVATAVAAAIKDTREADANIAAACVLAKQPTKASAFIKDGKALADVVAALQAGKVEGSGREISGHGSGSGESDPAQIAKSWDDVTDKVNAQFGLKRG